MKKVLARCECGRAYWLNKYHSCGPCLRKEANQGLNDVRKYVPKKKKWVQVEHFEAALRIKQIKKYLLEFKI